MRWAKDFPLLSKFLLTPGVLPGRPPPLARFFARLFDLRLEKERKRRAVTPAGAGYVRLGLPSTLVHHENGAFRKRSSNRKNWKHWLSDGFRVDGKRFDNGVSSKRWCFNKNHVISLHELSSNTNPNWPVVVVFFNSSGVMWTENISCVFRVKPPFSNSSGLVRTGDLSYACNAVKRPLTDHCIGLYGILCWRLFTTVFTMLYWLCTRSDRPVVSTRKLCKRILI